MSGTKGRDDFFRDYEERIGLNNPPFIGNVEHGKTLFASDHYFKI